MRTGVVLAAILAVGAAGCGGHGGGPGSAADGSGAGASAVAFAACMRAHAVPRYPDPDTSGHLAKESLVQLGVSSATFAAAESACRHLLPGGGRPPDQAMRAQIRALSLRFARCVRAHGVEGFPDPGSDGRIPDPASVGIDQGSPKFEAANQACRAYRPPYVPSNAAFNAWARTHGS